MKIKNLTYALILMFLLEGCYQQRAVLKYDNYKEYTRKYYRTPLVIIRYFKYDDEGNLLKKGVKKRDLRGCWGETVSYSFTRFDSITYKKVERVKQKHNGKLSTKVWSYEKYRKWY